jgi:di/tricarboxylate transporter
MIIITTLSSNLGWDWKMVRCAMILSCVFISIGLISPEEAANLIKLRIVILVASSISIGTAVLKSGVATAFGQLILILQIPYYLLPGLLFFMTGITTQFIHNNACASFFYPLALGISETLGINMKPLAISIAVASSCSFATPIGYEW